MGAEPGRETSIRGAGRMTFVVGALVVLAAWGLGRVGLPAAYRPVGAVMAELLAGLLVLLAWRFRRSRLALAAVIVALANTLLRGPLADQPGLELVALSLLLPINLSVLALQRDLPLPRLTPAVHLALILAQPWAVRALIGRMTGGGEDSVTTGAWLELLEEPRTVLLVLLISAVLTGTALAVRRGAFEGSLLWVLAATAVAVGVAADGDRAALFLTAAQLVLLAGLVEDSYRLAFHDELTGLKGRRALEDAMRHLNGSFALAMVDVDHFKRFNDRHGHDAGDQALRMVAEELRRVGGGHAYRYGGEEFVIAFPGRSSAEAKEAAEELREAIGERPFTVRSSKRPRKKPKKGRPASVGRKKARLTVSIGVAGSNSRRPGAAAVLRAADKALYRAKGRGRNRVVKV